MLDKLSKLCAPYLKPLTIDGMTGRQMTYPTRNAKHKRKILFVYGIHGNMERFYGVIYFLARYGTIIAPDLPGFGGMETFYKIGKKPSLDNYADYLANFVKKEFAGQKFSIAGLSYGFVVVTRMLQRYPELSDQVDIVMSVVGLADSNDFAISPPARRLYMTLFWLFRHQPFRWIAYNVFFKERILRLTYRPSHPKMKALSPEERPQFIKFEEYLWQINDLRTYGVAMHELFVFRHPDIQLPLAVHHIGTPHDHWLNDAHVRQELTRIYAKLVYHESSITNHGGTAYDDETEAREMVPDSLIKVLDAS